MSLSLYESVVNRIAGALNEGLSDDNNQDLSPEEFRDLELIARLVVSLTGAEIDPKAGGEKDEIRQDDPVD